MKNWSDEFTEITSPGGMDLWSHFKAQTPRFCLTSHAKFLLACQNSEAILYIFFFVG